MMTEEFKTLVFNTADQWGSGLLHRVRMLKGGGVGLCTMPAFDRWIQKIEGNLKPSCLGKIHVGEVIF